MKFTINIEEGCKNVTVEDPNKSTRDLMAHLEEYLEIMIERLNFDRVEKVELKASLPAEEVKRLIGIGINLIASDLKSLEQQKKYMLTADDEDFDIICDDHLWSRDYEPEVAVWRAAMITAEYIFEKASEEEPKKEVKQHEQ